MRRPAAPLRRDSRQTNSESGDVDVLLQREGTVRSNIRREADRQENPELRAKLRSFKQENLPFLLSLFIQNRDETFGIIPAAAVTLKVT